MRTPGSIWSPEGQLVRLGTDVKAFRIHDVVMIVVGESLAASTDGQVKNTRASNASSGCHVAVRRAEGRATRLQNLVGADRRFGADGAGAEHDRLEPGDDLRRRGGGCAAQRDAGGAGHAAVDLLRSRRS